MRSSARLWSSIWGHVGINDIIDVWSRLIDSSCGRIYWLTFDTGGIYIILHKSATIRQSCMVLSDPSSAWAHPNIILPGVLRRRGTKIG